MFAISSAEAQFISAIDTSPHLAKADVESPSSALVATAKPINSFLIIPTSSISDQN
jgi:hypothetical protein